MLINKMKKVLAMGTFDFLHPGHLNYLKQAKKHGKLIVVVARDVNVKRERGKMLWVNEKDRLRLVGELKFVDIAVLGNIGDKLKIVEKIKPDVICLGYDQNVNIGKLKKELERRGLKRIKIKRMKGYKAKRYKSSKIKKWGVFS